LLAAVGLLCSVALELAHYQAYVDPARAGFCRAGASFDCTTVALSQWSVFLGMPVPMWGVTGFFALAILAWWRSTWFLAASAVAAIASVLLFLVEVISVHSVCLLCELVHVIALSLFALAWRGRGQLVATDRVALAQLLSMAVAIPICAYLMMEPYWASYSWRSGVHLPTGIDQDGHHWIGAERPKVVLNEYVDYGCPHCAVATSHTKRLLETYARTLRVVRHEYPRMRCLKTPELMHCAYARAAICAGDQGAFWQADSWLFEHGAGRLTVDLQKAARDLHIDYGALQSCMASDGAFARANAEMDDATAHHIIDAPSYVIDGKRYGIGEVFATLKQVL
jgi:uncharacterized membrane protein/protein-disulfide isomerase